MRSFISATILTLSLAVAPSGVTAQSLGPREQAAASAAEAWLVHINAGMYEESWAQASPAFQSAVTAQQWAASVRQVLNQTGALVKREVSTVTPTTNPPGAPAGEYMVVAYKSGFVSAPTAIETVVLREEGSDWKVVGYFVRPA